MKTSYRSILRTLGSLRLAVVILGSLAVVLAGATIYESVYGTQAAQQDIYGATWFAALLVLLAVNVAAATLLRWPWRLRHVGFVVTHAGILVILGGCLMSNQLGTIGRLVLVEGGSDNRVVLDDWVIRAAADEAQADAAEMAVGRPPRPGRTAAIDVAGRSHHVQVLRYIPDAEVRQQVVEGGPGDPAGVLVEVQAAGQSWPQWLLVDDPGPWSVRMPGFTLAAASAYTPAESTGGKGTIVAAVDGRRFRIDVAEALAGPVAVAGGEMTVRVSEYFEHARVQGRQLREDPTAPSNPVVVLEVTQGDVTETRHVFAQFGDIRAMHGAQTKIPVDLTLEHPRAATEITLVPGPDGWILYEQDGGELVQQSPMRPDEPVALGKMPMTLVLRQVLPRARTTSVVIPRQSNQGDPQPAVQVEVTGGDRPERTWLLWGRPEAVGDGGLRLVLQAREVALPFEVRLEAFEIEQYPGTARPAMFRSTVTVLDPQGSAEPVHAKIEMNRPLAYGGWSFFQNSYTTAGGRQVSILAASKDPGKWVVFLGSALLVLGTVILALQRLVPRSGRRGGGDRAPAFCGSQAARQPEAIC